MDELTIPQREEPGFKEVLCQFGGPAFIRRAAQVHETFEELKRRCRQKRGELLAMVRLHLGRLRALAGDWQALRPLLQSDNDVQWLRDLYDELQPKLRLALSPTESTRPLRNGLRELAGSVARFNQRWSCFLQELDLHPVNKVREGHNRYYVLEKEFAVRSPRIARQGFIRMDPLTVQDLRTLFPPLHEPALA